MAGAVGARRRDFEIGRVIDHTFAVLGSNFPVLAGLALLLTALPQMVIELGSAGAMQEGAFQPSLSLVAGAGGLVSAIGAFVLQAALVHGAIADLNGRPVRFGECLRTGLNNFLPVLGISILMWLGIAIGAVLLIVPGLFVMVLWSVSIPVRVVERKGVFASMGRSGELTRGSRWPIFGLFILYFVIMILASVALVGLPTALLGATVGLTADSLVFRAFVSPVINALVAVIGAAGTAALYTELRTTKEGAAPDTLAAVFD